MKFKVLYKNKIIGESGLEFFDDGMNVRSGKFIPYKDYKDVKFIFKMYSDSQPLTSKLITFKKPVNKSIISGRSFGY